jgi:hypothetical protein
MEALLFVPCLIVFGIVGVIAYIVNQQPKEKWCENCNKWSEMEHQTGNLSGYVCPNCKWLNQETYGCPKCGWYGKYENGLISRRGPFLNRQKRSISATWYEIIEEDVYEEVVLCPKHGEFTVLIPARLYRGDPPIGNFRKPKEEKNINTCVPNRNSPLTNNDPSSIEISLSLDELALVVASTSFCESHFQIRQQKESILELHKINLRRHKNLVRKLEQHGIFPRDIKE